jgi:hypothetical protein
MFCKCRDHRKYANKKRRRRRNDDTAENTSAPESSLPGPGGPQMDTVINHSEVWAGSKAERPLHGHVKPFLESIGGYNAPRDSQPFTNPPMGQVSKLYFVAKPLGSYPGFL